MTPPPPSLIGFTGTQKGMTKQQLAALTGVVRFLPLCETGVVHGDCVGSDEQLDELAYKFGVWRRLRPCTVVWKRAFSETERPLNATWFEPEEPLVRNKKIVNDALRMIAAPRGAEIRRSGTWTTVRYALQAGRDVHIVWPDGTWTERRASK